MCVCVYFEKEREREIERESDTAECEIVLKARMNKWVLEAAWRYLLRKRGRMICLGQFQIRTKGKKERK